MPPSLCRPVWHEWRWQRGQHQDARGRHPHALRQVDACKARHCAGEARKGLVLHHDRSGQVVDLRRLYGQFRFAHLLAVAIELQVTGMVPSTGQHDRGSHSTQTTVMGSEGWVMVTAPGPRTSNPVGPYGPRSLNAKLAAAVRTAVLVLKGVPPPKY